MKHTYNCGHVIKEKAEVKYKEVNDENNNNTWIIEKNLQTKNCVTRKKIFQDIFDGDPLFSVYPHTIVMHKYIYINFHCQIASNC